MGIDSILFILSVVYVGVHGRVNYPALYVFGDSWSDDNGVLSCWKQFRLPESPPNNYRFSNGHTWPFFLARDYMNLTCDWYCLSLQNDDVSNCTEYMNFATGGACTHNWGTAHLDAYCSLRPYNNQSRPQEYATTVLGQVDAWKAFNKTGAKDALFAIFIGGNDFNGLLQMNGPLTEDLKDIGRINDVLQNLEVAIGALYRAGARNFLVLNFPSIFISPRGLVVVSNVAFKAIGNQFVGDYLAKLQHAMNNNFGYTDITLYAANLYGCLNEIAVGKYGGWAGGGFNRTKVSCVTNNRDPNTTVCPNPETAVWWDDIHPTTSFHKFIAKLMNELMTKPNGACLSSSCIKSSLYDHCFDGGNSLRPPLGMIVLVALLILALSLR